MKKLSYYVGISILMSILSGCGGDDNKDDNKKGSSTSAHSSYTETTSIPTNNKMSGSESENFAGAEDIETFVDTTSQTRKEPPTRTTKNTIPTESSSSQAKTSNTDQDQQDDSERIEKQTRLQVIKLNIIKYLKKRGGEIDEDLSEIIAWFEDEKNDLSNELSVFWLVTQNANALQPHGNHINFKEIENAIYQWKESSKLSTETKEKFDKFITAIHFLQHYPGLAEAEDIGPAMTAYFIGDILQPYKKLLLTKKDSEKIASIVNELLKECEKEARPGLIITRCEKLKEIVSIDGWLTKEEEMSKVLPKVNARIIFDEIERRCGTNDEDKCYDKPKEAIVNDEKLEKEAMNRLILIMNDNGDKAIAALFSRQDGMAYYYNPSTYDGEEMIATEDNEGKLADQIRDDFGIDTDSDVKKDSRAFIWGLKQKSSEK
jgi:hypothetical protein